MKKILLPVSYIYRQMMALRNYLYDQDFLPTHTFDVPVVSVGNLTLGGTGKTPFICELLRWSLEQGLRPAMISRGYKGRIQGVAKVPADAQSHIYGDEPTMVAHRFSTVPVYIGSDRVEVMKELLKNENVQIVFADDAYQHRRLGRDIDIVIVDCTEKIENYAVIPVGRGRESFMGLRRADFIILTKVNLATPDQKQKALDFLDEICGDLKIPVIEGEYYISQLVRLDGLKRELPTRYERVALISGIGNPQAFETLLNKNLDVRKHFVFRDHHDYSPEDIDVILRETANMDLHSILTTEKDAVKLRRFASVREKIWATELAPKLSLRVKNIYEEIIGQCRK